MSTTTETAFGATLCEVLGNSQASCSCREADRYKLAQQSTSVKSNIAKARVILVNSLELAESKIATVAPSNRCTSVGWVLPATSAAAL